MKDKNPMTIALAGLARIADPVIQKLLDEHGRNTPRDALYMAVGKAFKEQDDELCRAATSRLVVDRIVKTRSDRSYPTLEQLGLFDTKDELVSTLTPIIHEAGDGSVTPFGSMLMDDFDDELAREQEHVRRVMDKFTKRTALIRRLRPNMIKGMGSIDAYTTLWEEIRNGRDQRAA